VNIVVLGLSITSSWGNGHATTYRGLLKYLARRGHKILFLERDQPWYSNNRDLPAPPYCRTELYQSLEDLQSRFGKSIAAADLVIIGSYVPEGVAVGEWVLATATGVTGFYDIDTPVTLAKLERGDAEYISRDLVKRYDLYLSFTGGPTLQVLQTRYNTPNPHGLYCSVDSEHYYPDRRPIRWDLGYLGTYSEDRQPGLDALMLHPARQWQAGRFCVAGSLYPDSVEWPENIERIEHLPPGEHRAFYNAQRFTLNVTRADMVRAGYSPSVRIFEAAACGIPIISDYWEGLEDLFEIGSEIMVADSSDDVLRLLREVPEPEPAAIGRRARAKVLRDHTAARRAEQLEGYALELIGRLAESRAVV
jgi:spore maturation protein CgeB